MNTANSHDSFEAARPKTNPLTRHLPAIARILMGLPLIVFGLNAFFNFIPPPTTPLPKKAAAFAGALANTSYMMQLIGATQLVGLLLVLNRFVPLALALLRPSSSTASHFTSSSNTQVFRWPPFFWPWKSIWLGRIGTSIARCSRREPRPRFEAHPRSLSANDAFLAAPRSALSGQNRRERARRSAADDRLPDYRISSGACPACAPGFAGQHGCWRRTGVAASPL
jgi:hypothetical protein